MAFDKLNEFTNEKIQKLIEDGDVREVLLYGNKATRERAATLINKRINGTEQPNMWTLQSRIFDLKRKVEELQERAAENVPDPMKYIAYQDMATAEGMGKVASVLINIAANFEKQDQRIAELEVQLAQQAQPEVDEHQQARMDAMAKLLASKGFGVYDIDPTAYQGDIMCNDCMHYYEGGCLLHGVSEEVQADLDAERAEEATHEAELAQQEAAKGVTESAEEFDLDPAAPYRGSDDRPVVVAKPVEPETPRSKLRSDEYLTRVLEDLGLPGQFKLRQDGGYFWSLPDDGAHFFRVRCLMDHKDKIEQQLRDGSLNPSIFDTCQECGTHMPPEETLSEIVQDGSVNKTEREKYVGIITNLEHKLRESSADLKDMCDMNTQLTTESMKLKKQLAERETPSEIVSDCAYCAEVAKESHELQQQLAALEQDVDTLTDCDQVVKELAETKQMYQTVVEAKDKVILRNRELEQENTDLKRRIKMLEDLLVHNNIEVPA